jgi:hypothetical protein
MVLVAMPAGCARHAASQATSGAISSIEKSVRKEKPPGEEHATEIIARQAIEAGLLSLSSPRQMAQLRRVAEAAAEAAVARALDSAVAGSPSPIEQVASEAAGGFRDSLSSGLAGDLGENGPLVTSLSGTVQRVAASATEGTMGRLFPGCTAEDTACVDRRISALSREAADGFGRGLRESLGLPALILAFLAGAVVTLMVLLTLRHEVRRREPHPEVARAT